MSLNYFSDVCMVVYLYVVAVLLNIHTVESSQQPKVFYLYFHMAVDFRDNLLCKLLIWHGYCKVINLSEK